jgi:glycosyltransferase involved in cell wall biosynthesis
MTRRPYNRGPSGPRPYRVVHLADNHAKGGAARAAYRIHEALSAHSRIESVFLGIHSDSTAAKETLDQAFSGPRVFKPENLNRASAHIRHFLKPGVRLLYDFLFSRNIPLENWLLSQGADIAVVHWTRPRDLPARSLRRLQIPVVAVLHDARFVLGISHYPSGDRGNNGATRLTSVERIAAGIVRASLPLQSTTLICPSAWMGKTARLAGWPESVVRTIPLPLDTQFWHPARSLEETEDAAHRVFRVGFGFHGDRAAHRKGADVMAGALKLLAGNTSSTETRLEFYFFGDAAAPKHETEVFSAITLGPLRDAELREIMTQLDLVVVPSRTESFGLVAIEAQACGTAVVVSDNTGLETALVPGGGWLTANGDAGDLARIIALAWRDPAEVSRRGDIARQGVPQYFSEQRVAAQYVSHFDALREN